ncbi:hypothetical protein FNF29_04796 [Cafeteria roenbergensis]|uniref:Uncharacterized protein n=1 Tax=Cafeteria roenbergensis TaxID=33653 RepID=A0A5A8CDS5_CAFRO|nr:hypothetical protein FNF29_04796 [Cafeteria roenbergensis]|eukprot:KAA0151105.1 hypothetical protein FNF29_04796 [Cafeteria roenbergensis]
MSFGRLCGAFLALLGGILALVPAALSGSVGPAVAGAAAVLLLASAAAVREAALGRNMATAGSCGDGIPAAKADDADAAAKAGGGRPAAGSDSVARPPAGTADKPAIGPKQPPEPLAAWQAHGAVAVGRLCLGVCALPVTAAATEGDNSPAVAVVAVVTAMVRGMACMAGVTLGGGPEDGGPEDGGWLLGEQMGQYSVAGSAANASAAGLGGALLGAGWSRGRR